MNQITLINIKLSLYDSVRCSTNRKKDLVAYLNYKILHCNTTIRYFYDNFFSLNQIKCFKMSRYFFMYTNIKLIFPIRSIYLPFTNFGILHGRNTILTDKTELGNNFEMMLPCFIIRFMHQN